MFIGHSEFNRSAFYLYTVNSEGLSATLLYAHAQAKGRRGLRSYPAQCLSMLVLACDLKELPVQ